MMSDLQKTKDPDLQIRGEKSEFHWKHSDNSFSFNFLPELTTSKVKDTAVSKDAQLVQEQSSESASGFSFNFQIPPEVQEITDCGKSESRLSQTGGVKMETLQTQVSVQSSETPMPSKSKKKKNKSKTGGGGDNEQQKQVEHTAGLPSEERTELSPEQQLRRELDWCVEQLELGLRTQKSSAKQKEEAVRALRTLQSSKAPLVKKRQVMRAMSGDYRRKMEEERQKQFKLIQTATTSAQVTSVTKPTRKAVFHRRAEQTHTPHTVSLTDEHTLTHTNGQNQRTDGFVFFPAQEEFRFNFL